MNILVINAGSSSLKYQLMDVEQSIVLAKGVCDRIGIDGVLEHTAGEHELKAEHPMKTHAQAIQLVIKTLLDGVIADISEIGAVGHRVVHGGEYFSGSVVIDNDVIAKITEVSPLAPLHNPGCLMGIAACREVMPTTMQVAVFDTAFHQTMPKHAYMYGLAYELYKEHKIRKYGFHGTSHKYVSKRAAKLLGKDLKELKLVTCHLGNGSSITAVKNGESVDTTMGFTPLDGIMMGTRCGSIDPAIVTYMINTLGYSASEVDNIMNKKSGALGISGVSSDFRDLDNAAAAGDKRAELALDLFAYQAVKLIGSMVAAMSGVDAIIFTAGIGENNFHLRQKVMEKLAYLGIQFDAEKNKQRGIETLISTPNSAVDAMVIPTNEEKMIALETKQLYDER